MNRSESDINPYTRPTRTAAWIEAMRLRTLPVSLAGVIVAVAYALLYQCFQWIPAMLCVLFAVTAQIASNFANEYYDFKAGLDRPGREGPRRGVTEGDISPRQMKSATYITLAAACVIGSLLLLFGPWWLILVGVAVALGVFAYSAGPFPLSHHGLGELAVMIFFGIVPVNLTFWLQAGAWNLWVALASVSVGMMGANVLIVNNYRDRDDDATVGKHTLAVRFGRPAMSSFYLTNGFTAVGLMVPTWLQLPVWSWGFPAIYLAAHSILWWHLTTRSGARLNRCLGMTAMAMFGYALLLLATAITIAVSSR